MANNPSKQVKIVARVVTYDRDKQKVLLMKNKGADFWYAPGEGWEYEKENIIECAAREVNEETGLNVNIKRLLYTQEFHEDANQIFFETFWLALPVGSRRTVKDHKNANPNGKIKTYQWFDEDEIRKIKVFPDRLKNTFWKNVGLFLREEDPFIGVK